MTLIQYLLQTPIISEQWQQRGESGPVTYGL